MFTFLFFLYAFRNVFESFFEYIFITLCPLNNGIFIFISLVEPATNNQRLQALQLSREIGKEREGKRKGKRKYIITNVSDNHKYF